MTNISFAQNQEDVMLWRALHGVSRGLYVDVGANDPVIDSVTWHFYQKGWRGINIEPVPHWHERLQNVRPLDINLRLAVSTEHGPLILYDVPGTGLSTIDPQVAEAYKSEGMPVEEISVLAVPLEELLEQHVCDRDIHFLKIDVEGAERAVLQSMALTRYRPWIILVEATAPRSPVPNQQQWENLLTTRGYQFAYFDGLNRFYLATERAAMKSAFETPPNVFDAFVRYAEWQMGENQQVLHEQLDRALSERQRLEVDHHRILHAHSQLRHEQDALVERQAELERAQRTLMSEYEELMQMHVGLKQALQDFKAVHQTLLDDHAALRDSHAGEAAARKALAHNHEALVERYEALRLGHEHLVHEHTLLKHANDWLQALNTQYGQEIGAQQKRLSDIMCSTSWRITGPLRRFGALLQSPVRDTSVSEPLVDRAAAPSPPPPPALQTQAGAPETVPAENPGRQKTVTADDLLLHQIQLHWRNVDRLEADCPIDHETQCALCGFLGPTDSFLAFDTQCQFGGGRLHRLQCPQCDVIFGPEKMLRLNATELGQEYDWHYRVFSEGDSTEQELRAFEALCPQPGGTYLNFGAGAWSGSVQLLRERGWNVIAYEPTESAQNQPGLVTRREALAVMKFDGIFSNNVLEHLRYPVQDLQFLARLLRPGGRMSHATPCFEYLYEYTRFHLFFYLGRSRQLLASGAGLRICRFEQDGHFMNALYEPANGDLT